MGRCEDPAVLNRPPRVWRNHGNHGGGNVAARFADNDIRSGEHRDDAAGETMEPWLITCGSRPCKTWLAWIWPLLETIPKHRRSD